MRTKATEKLTHFGVFFAHGNLIGRLAVWVRVARRIGTVDVAPASLLIGYDARVEGVIAEGCIRGVR